MAACASSSGVAAELVGMPWAWMAMRLTAFSVASEPSRSITFAVGRPSRPLRATSTATRSPSSAPLTAEAAIVSSRPRFFLSIGTSRPPSPDLAEHAEHAVLGAIDHLDGAAVVVDGVVAVGRFLDPQQRLVADPRHLDRPRPARHVQADFRRLAVGLAVPFGGNRDQLAVGIASGDVGEDDARQDAGVVELLAVLFDVAFVGEVAQHLL